MAYEQLHSKKIEKMLIGAALKAIKMKPILAKETRLRGSTDVYCTKVCKPIKQSTICIADLTYNSINVGLECGVAQHFEKPIIVTTYKPRKTGQITNRENRILKKLKKSGAIQYLPLPYHPPDFASLFRVEYSNKAELISGLRNGFNIGKR